MKLKELQVAAENAAKIEQFKRLLLNRRPQ